MFRQKQTIRTALAVAIVVFFGCDALKAQSEVKDDFADIRQLSDSLVAIIAQAILQKDSTLLSSAFTDDVDVVMPGRISLKGKPSFMKHVPLFYEKVGGWKLTTSHQQFEQALIVKGWVKERGKYELAEPTEKGPGQVWKGSYLASWRLHEEKWVLNSLLLSKK